MKSTLWRFAIMLLLVFLVLSCLFPATQSKNIQTIESKAIEGWSEEVLLSNLTDGTWGEQPDIATHGEVVHVVYENPLLYRRSSDGGQSWTDEKRITYIQPYTENPKIAVKENTLHLVYEVGLAEIYYKRSLDNGDTWESDVLLSDDDGMMSGNAQIAISGNNVHVVWQDEKDYGWWDQCEIYYKRSIDNGSVWDDGLGNTSTVRRLTFDAADSATPIIAVDGNTIHVVWADSRSGNYEAWYMRSENNGESWTEPKNITPLDGIVSDAESIVVDGEKVYVVGDDVKWINGHYRSFRIWLLKSEDNGKIWSYSALIDYSTLDYFCTEPWIAVDKNKLFLIWGDNQSSSADIYYKHSTDYGKTWSEHIRVTYSGKVGGGRITLGGKNNMLHLVWQDKRTGVVEVFYKRSPRFAANITLTTEPNILTADGFSTSTIIATVLNKTGSPIQGLTVNFNIESGSGTLLQSSNLTDSNGCATTTFVAGTIMGNVVINVSVDNIWNTTIISLIPGPIAKIEITPGIVDLYVGENQTFTVTGYDAFGNINTSWTPYWHVDGNIGIINTAGFFTATKKGMGAVNCSDNVTGVYNISVVNVLNSKPVLETIGNQTVYEGQLFELQINVTDLDGDTLAFSDNSSLFDINSTTGLISFTPSYNSAGTYFINVTVTDGEELVWRAFKLTIINVNRAPTAIIFSPTDNAEFTTKDSILFDATDSYDPDNDNLTYTWTSSIDRNIGSTASFSKKLSKGTHTITLAVDDGNGGTDTAQIIVTVSKPSEPSGGFIPGFETASPLAFICILAIIIILLRKRKT